MLISKIKILLTVFLVLLPSIAFGGDPAPIGTCMKKDSYCFTEEEASRLADRISELEIKEDLLSVYKDLDFIDKQTFDAYEKTIKLRDAEIETYQSLYKISEDRINQLEKKEKWNRVQKYIFFGLGVALTTGTFVAVESVVN